MRVLQDASTVIVTRSTVREVASLIATTCPTDPSAVAPAQIPAQYQDVSMATKRHSVVHRRRLLVTATIRPAAPPAQNEPPAVKVTRFIYLFIKMYKQSRQTRE